MLEIERMAAVHLEGAVQQSQAVGWPHTLNDWRFALELGHGLVVMDETTVVGTMLWWPQGPSHATLGLVIVAPTHQRQGIAHRLLTATLAEVGDRSVVLNATSAALRLYERGGFSSTGQVIQQQGIASLPADRPGELLKPVEIPELVDTEELVSLDAAAAGANRRPLIDALLAAGEVLELRRSNVIVGYSVCRAFGNGMLIGPVVAPDIEGAKSLIDPWIAANQQTFVRIDVPAGCGLADWLTDRGLATVGGVTTMLRGPAVAPPSERGRIFALASQALG